MSENKEWVEFEAWMDDISICGYMNVEDADDEHPIEFYGYDGLECGSHISNTKYPSFSDDQHYRWDVLSEWFNETDIPQILVDHSDEETVLKFRAEDDFGRLFIVELYVNCSKLGNVDIPKEADGTTTIRIKRSTKERLAALGSKGDSYDDIVDKLISSHNVLMKKIKSS